MSKTTLHLEYSLGDHGWAKSVLTVGTNRFEFENAYGSDPIGGLARLAVRWGAGVGVSKTDIVFDCENRGDYIAQFNFRDPAEFELWHQPFHVQTDDSTPPRTRIAFASIDGFSFALNIAKVLDNLIRTHGFVGYINRWQHHSYPIREYMYLRLLLDRSPIIEKIAQRTDTSSFDLELELLRQEPDWSTSPRTNALAAFELPHDM